MGKKRNASLIGRMHAEHYVPSSHAAMISHPRKGSRPHLADRRRNRKVMENRVVLLRERVETG
jgi:hypothetical protein